MEPKVLIIVPSVFYQGYKVLEKGWEPLFLKYLLKEAGWPQNFCRIIPATDHYTQSDTVEKNPEILLNLKNKIETLNPLIVVAMGVKVSEMCTKEKTIAKNRGIITKGHADGCCPGRYVAATQNFVSARFDVKTKQTIIADLRKVYEWVENPISVLCRTIKVVEHLEDLVEMESACSKTDLLSFDIETNHPPPVITHVGLGVGEHLAYVLCFSRKRGHFWSFEDEKKVLEVLKRVMESDVLKIAHNGIYDIQWLWKMFKIKTKNFQHDTMLAHRAIFSEMPRGLGFLGSIYTQDGAWKENWNKSKKSTEIYDYIGENDESL